jgi:hypothetical protein
LPYDEGSLFTRILNTPDDINLDSFNKNIFKVCFLVLFHRHFMLVNQYSFNFFNFKKTLFHLKAQQSKLKSILNEPAINSLFYEVAVSVELSLHLYKFFIMMYNTGTRQQQNSSKAVGLNVINVGVSNLNQTVRTDLANK